MSNASLRAALEEAAHIPDPSATAPPQVAYKLDLDSVAPPPLAKLASQHSLSTPNRPIAPAELELPLPENAPARTSRAWVWVAAFSLLLIGFVLLASAIVLLAMAGILLV